MSEQDLRLERLKKLDRLRAAGMEPYPAHTDRDASVADFLATFDASAQSGRTVTLGGRLMSLRGQGGIMFADLFDGTGKCQAVFQKTEMDEAFFALFAEAIDIGDFIEVSGTAFTTKRGERSLQAKSWKVLAKSLMPIPDGWFGLKDEEKIIRERYLDILVNADVRALFERRSAFWKTIRDFYAAHGFLEVETPVLESSPGGADARPFLTHHNALDIEVSLRISLELWLKRLLVAGFPKVFEIGRIFRNEGQSREHLQDYTQIESYEAYSDMAKGMEFVKDLYREIAKQVYGRYSFEIGDHTVDLADEWSTVDYCDVIKRTYGIDPISCSEDVAIQAVRDARIEVSEALNKNRAIDLLWKAVRKTISGPAFLINQPAFLEPLAKRSAGDSAIVERMQVIIAGSEMGKGFSELNDPLDQRARFEEQQKLRDAGDDEAQRLDEEYVRAMEYGMPPSFGFGMSERLFAFLENKPVHLTQLFPLVRPRDVL